MADKTYTGIIEKKVVGVGSKSEHLATVLTVSPTQSYRMRILGGNSFHEPAFDPFVGKRASVRGELLHGHTLQIADLGKINIKPPAGPAPSI